MASKLALIPLVPLQYDYPDFQEIARRVEKRLDEIVLLGTEVATTSGTSIDFTGIPSWVTQIEINFVGVSTNGTSAVIVQIGDPGGIETSGYLGAASGVVSGGTASANFTSGYGVVEASAATSVLHGTVALTLENASNFTWVARSVMGRSDAALTHQGGGSKSTSAALDRVRITTAGGTDTFDAGKINIRMS